MTSRAPRRPRPPAFVPVPTRARADGWTPERQAGFLGALAETGSVSAAARRVGLSRETAYRLRAHPEGESFAAAWDVIVGKVPKAPKRKVTTAGLLARASRGRLRPVMYRGRHVATVRIADNSALLSIIHRLDRMVSPAFGWPELTAPLSPAQRVTPTVTARDRR